MRRIRLTIFFLLLAVLGRAEAGNYIFEHIQTSTHWINSIYQDNDGFIWISSRNGLYRCLGDNPSDYETVFEGDSYYDILQDRDDILWVKKRNGFVKYDIRTNTFTDEETTASSMGSSIWINVFQIDEDGNYWWAEEDRVYVRRYGGTDKFYVGSVDGQVNDIFCRDGLSYVLTYEGNVFRFSVTESGRADSYPVMSAGIRVADVEHSFNCIFVDSSHNLWLSQGAHGVWVFPHGGGNPKYLSSYRGDNKIQPGYISDFEEDAQGNIWLISDRGGICICNSDADVLTILTNDPEDGNTIASDGVYAIFKDRDDNIWLGYTKKGLSLYRGENKTWSMMHLNILHDRNLLDDINTTCEDDKGNLWFGTDGQGLICLDVRTGVETLYTTENSALKSNVITDIHCDPQGRIWIATFYGGMSCIEDGRMRTYTYEQDGSGLASENVWSIDNDRTGRIWIGTLGGGIQSLDVQSGQFETFRSEDLYLSNNYVQKLECSEDGRVYVATAYGLSIFDPQTLSSTIVCRSEDMVQEGISGLEVDSRGLVWLDEDGILQVYDPVSDVFYTPKHPALKAVRGLIEDNSDNMWIITDSGLCRAVVYRSHDDGYEFDISSFSFPRLNDLHFNQRSVCITSDGDFLIGSFCGYMLFSPDRYPVEYKGSTDDLHFIRLYVGNQLIRPGAEYNGEIILEEALDYTDELVLGSDNSHISIEYVSLDFLSVYDNDLFYRLEGFSDEWITADKNTRRITFTNLSPGQYRLVLVTDMSVPSDAISLSITIRPPWWASWWAITVYFVVVSLIIFIIRRLQIAARKRKEEHMEYIMKQEQRHYVDEMKMQFFTNVSHEFRTPLTLILTPVEEMISKNPQAKDDQFISTIHRNALRLLNLVNEVLDLRKIETYGTELSLKKSDLVSVLNEAVTSFRLMSESLGVDLIVDNEVQSLVFDFDEGKILKVISNLMSNAFKFTPKGGSVTVRLLVETEDFVTVEVRDTGTGVADKDKRRIFDRFYQAKTSPVGSGIGLHIVREFVLLHGGDVYVTDNDPSGAVFRFTLPVNANMSEEVENGADEDKEVDLSSGIGRNTILVVDDSDDFRAFMKSSLSSEYNVLEASDGVEALKVMAATDVDVVVSDVMMPGMDGTEFCRRVKSDINTSHIPVILLTAKAMTDDECYGLESGADDYLTKPFNMSILRLRIAKFIEWKKRAKKLFEQELEITTEQIALTSMDDRLLQQAINIINENISNSEFSVSELSASLCMHRTNLYKKLLYLTGKTPVEFIRAIRLKRAAALLETDGVYISEIAYMVGFNSPKVFAGHFRDEFGCSPSEYRKKHLNVLSD